MQLSLIKLTLSLTLISLPDPQAEAHVFSEVWYHMLPDCLLTKQSPHPWLHLQRLVSFFPLPSIFHIMPPMTYQTQPAFRRDRRR
jgi:hypothetical protein